MNLFADIAQSPFDSVDVRMISKLQLTDPLDKAPPGNQVPIAPAYWPGVTPYTRLKCRLRALWS